jgi:predicted amidophosphoribosyltransferase
MTYDQWKLASPDDEGYNMVTPCCGASYTKSWISDCCILEMYTNTDMCPGCGKQAEATGYICNECENWTEDLEEDYEYEARMEENHLEEKAEARRKYGE